jgi:hypothetical protein
MADITSLTPFSLLLPTHTDLKRDRGYGGAQGRKAFVRIGGGGGRLHGGKVKVKRERHLCCKPDSREMFESFHLRLVDVDVGKRNA